MLPLNDAHAFVFVSLRLPLRVYFRRAEGSLTFV